MKISSASKKVLASALSAAMVVAFAPTAAFGMVKSGEYVKVVLDPGVGQVAPGGVAASKLEAAVVATADNQITIDDSMFADYAALKAYTSDGKAASAGVNDLQKFVYDFGTADDTSDDVEITTSQIEGNYVLTLPSTVQPNATITLKAAYGTPATISATATAGLYNTTTGAVDQKKSVDGSTPKKTQVYTATISGTGKYAMSLRKDGTELASVSHDTGTGVTYTFTWDGEGEGALKSSDWGAGTWSVVLVKDGKDVKTVEKVKVVKIAVKGGVWGSSAADMALETEVLTTAGKTVSGGTAENNVRNALISAGWTAPKKTITALAYASALFDESGVKVADINPTSGAISYVTGSEIKGDMNLTANFGEATVAPKMSLTGATGSYGISATFTGDNATYEANGYRVEFAGPGVSKSLKNQAAGTVSYNFGTSDPAAGTYTATVYGTKLGTSAEEEIGKATIALVEYSYDVDGKADKIATTGLAIGGEKWGAQLSQTVSNAKARLLGWTIDGSTLLTTNSVIPSDVTSVVLKAAWDDVQVAAPTFTYANGYLTFASAAGAGFKITCSGKNSTTGTLAIKVDPSVNTVYTAQVVRDTNCTSTLKDSEQVVVNPYSATVAVKDIVLGAGAATSTSETAVQAIEATAGAIMAGKTAAYTDKVPEYYLTVMKATKDAAVKAIKDHGYDTVDGWSAAILSQTEAVLKAVADYDKAQIDAYAAGVKQADGTVIKVNAAVAAAAKANIDKVIADYGFATDAADAKTVPSKARVNLTAYAEDMSAEVKAAAKAGDVFSAADVTDAEAVTAQLQAAKTASEANAALEAFEALTSTQKELVAAADVAAAQKIVLVAQQDKTAAANGKAQVKGETYKIKAKGSKTIKIAKSTSGAKVTLKQVSGTKYAKVSGTKVTLKKAAKKGKTYTVKVKAVCGATTTSTVSFKVLVK